jgi:hypothetical protein
MNNLLALRTRLDNGERRGRGHGLIWTCLDARTGIYGTEGRPSLRAGGLHADRAGGIPITRVPHGRLARPSATGPIPRSGIYAE